jgi:hypothetical protein
MSESRTYLYEIASLRTRNHQAFINSHATMSSKLVDILTAGGGSANPFAATAVARLAYTAVVFDSEVCRRCMIYSYTYIFTSTNHFEDENRNLDTHVRIVLCSEDETV